MLHFLYYNYMKIIIGMVFILFLSSYLSLGFVSFISIFGMLLIGCVRVSGLPITKMDDVE